MVYVINKNGNAVMPTQRNGRVGWLLRHKLAVVVNVEPFVIQLLYEGADHVQDVTLGVDAGTKHVGFSINKENKIPYGM